MPFVLVIIGILMIVTGAQGTYAQFGSQVSKDFTGNHGFIYWVASIGAIGALGYVDSLRTVSRLLMALIVIAMVLANKGFFAQFQNALKKGPVAPNPVSNGGGPVQSQNTQSDVTNLMSSPSAMWNRAKQLFGQ